MYVQALEHFPGVSRPWIRQMRPSWAGVIDQKGRIPLVDRWEEIQVAVAGGAGKHSAFIPTFGATKPVTRAIARKDGRAIRSVREFKEKRS